MVSSAGLATRVLPCREDVPRGVRQERGVGSSTHCCWLVVVWRALTQGHTTDTRTTNKQQTHGQQTHEQHTADVVLIGASFATIAQVKKVGTPGTARHADKGHRYESGRVSVVLEGTWDRALLATVTSAWFIPRHTYKTRVGGERGSGGYCAHHTSRCRLSLQPHPVSHCLSLQPHPVSHCRCFASHSLRPVARHAAPPAPVWTAIQRTAPPHQSRAG